jgi:MFS transporter, Spinster family, sphingosine-1-phosphate transporter
LSSANNSIPAENADTATIVSARRRNWSLALLFLAGVLNIFDRQIVNILAQSIKADLGLTDAQLGLLTGTAFGLFYAVLGIPLGRLADRVNRVKLMATVLVLWSALTVVCGMAGNFLQLLVARMGVGVGEAGSQPASTALVADLFEPARRTSAMSALLVSASAGGFLGLALGGYVAAHWGWRTAFFVAGAPGILLAIVMLVAMRDPRNLRQLKTASPPFLQTVAILWRNPRFKWLALGLICISYFAYAGAAWLPAYFIRVHGMTTSQIGGFAALGVGLGGGLGTLGCGLICDALRSRVRHVEIKALMLTMTLAVVSLLITVGIAQRSVALGAMFFFFMSTYAFFGPTVTLIQNEASPQTRSLAIAVCISVSNIVNLGVAIYAVGALSDALKPQYGNQALGYALGIGAVIAALLGLTAHSRVIANTSL